MNPNDDQIDQSSTAASSTDSASDTSQPSADNPLGPRPVAPAYEPQTESADPIIQQPPKDEPDLSENGNLAGAQPPEAPVVSETPKSPEQTTQKATINAQNFAVQSNDTEETAISNGPRGSGLKRFVIFFIAIVGGFLALGTFIFLVMNLTGGGGADLQEYKSEKYSILYPKGMEVEEDRTDIEIREPGKRNGSIISVMSTIPISSNTDDFVSVQKEQLKKQTENVEGINVISTKDKKMNGMTFVILEVEDKTGVSPQRGILAMALNGKEDVLYFLTIQNSAGGLDVMKSSEAILQSFTAE